MSRTVILQLQSPNNMTDLERWVDKYAACFDKIPPQCLYHYKPEEEAWTQAWSAGDSGIPSGERPTSSDGEHSTMKTLQTNFEPLPVCAASVSRGTQWYHRVYDVLVRNLQAPEELRMSFVFAHTEASPCYEFRFQGNLGFGGKYCRKTNTVDCYHEDATAGRLALIEVANASLASLNVES